jgi:hypothetical protein
MWPRLRGLTRRAFEFQAKDEDRDCVAAEAFEAVLVLSAKTISEANRQVLIDLEPIPSKHLFNSRTRAD